MAFSNNMTLLLNKIESRLGVDVLELPDKIKKNMWPEKVIIPDTIVTWSRFYPNEFKYKVDSSHKMKNGWYLLDEDVFQNCKILGVKNLDWGAFNSDSFGGQSGVFDYLSGGYDIGDTFGLIGQANINSLFNNGIYPVFEPPNRFRLEATYGNKISIKNFTVILLIEHSPNLLTISPTQMETFESLAQADIANFLYQKLKMYQDVQTIFANVNLRLEDLQSEAQKRDEIINYIKDSYVSASNKNQPYLICV